MTLKAKGILVISSDFFPPAVSKFVLKLLKQRKGRR